MAKEFIAGKLILNLEDSAHIVDWYLGQLLFENKLETPEEVLKKIKKVNQNDIKRVANRILKQEKLNLAVIGPFNKDWNKKIRNLISKYKF